MSSLFHRKGDHIPLPPPTIFGTTPTKNVIVCRLCGSLVYSNFHLQHSAAHDLGILGAAEKMSEPTDGEAVLSLSTLPDNWILHYVEENGVRRIIAATPPNLDPPDGEAADPS